MDKVIVSFEGQKTLSRICEIVESGGIEVYAQCRSAAEVKRKAAKLDHCIVLCGYKLLDVTAESLFADLPKGTSMLMLATQEQLGMCENEEIFRLAAPANRSDLLSSLNMLLQLGAKHKRAVTPQRSNEEKELIRQAKELLMVRNCMSEEQAHRFIQKRSMDTGAKMSQTAKLILGDMFS